MPITAAAHLPARRAVHDLRQARRSTRLGRLEWFEVAYRAYLVVLVGGFLVGVVASWLPADPLSVTTRERLFDYGPGVVGLAIVAVWGSALRQGARGGPVSLEAPDIRWLMLAPLPRRVVLVRPALQRLATMTGSAVVVSVAAAVVTSSRLGGGRLWWLVTGAAVGVLTGAGAWAVAVISHITRLSLPWARIISTVAVGLSVAIAAARVPGPASAVGDAALWPATRETASITSGLVSAAVVGLAVAVAWRACDRLSPERLERRTQLVARLRFALALGDLRTVMLIRRQLSHEQRRTRPWWRVPTPKADAPSHRQWLIWRGLASLSRLPLHRVVRLIMWSVAAGVIGAVVVEGSLGLIPFGASVMFIIGLELSEPLAQTLDNDEQRQLLPQPSGVIGVGVLAAGVMAAIPLALVAVGVSALMTGSLSAVGVGALIGLPVMWGGMAGAVVNVVRGAPDPMVRTQRALSMPPEVAGLTTLVQTVWPLVVSTIGVAPLLFVTAAVNSGGSPMAAGVRGAVASLLWGGAVVAWVRWRDEMRRWWRDLVAAGDQARRDASRRRATRAGAT